MERQIVQQAIDNSIEKLLAHDQNLFEMDASEWALSFRLGFYLVTEFSDWDVDCEYNRQGTGQDPKRNSDSHKVRPDIIVHKRGKLDCADNLLVIEIKKRKNDQERWNYQDFPKLRGYTAPPDGDRTFQYKWGVALIFDNRDCEKYWFRGGVDFQQE